MRRRYRKSSPWKTIPLWSIALALVGWGVWQAELLRRTMIAQGSVSTTQPVMAVGSANVVAQGAQGGEPWTMPAADMEPADPAADTLVLGNGPDAIDQPFLQPTPVFDAALSSDQLFAQGKELLDNGQIAAGRFALNAALSRTTDDAVAAELRSILTNLNAPVFMGTAVLPDDPCARFVDIQSGDTYLSLGRTYGTPAEFIHLINPALNPNNLKLLTGVKIVQGPFHMRISKRASRLDLYARDMYVASCAVEFPDGNYLPRGDYQITAGTKLQLGGRTWIGFEGHEPATEEITNGWLFGTAGPRGTDTKNRATGIHLADSDLEQLYRVLAEARSHLRVEP
jgi:hypothetical protein